MGFSIINQPAIGIPHDYGNPMYVYITQITLVLVNVTHQTRGTDGYGVKEYTCRHANAHPFQCLGYIYIYTHMYVYCICIYICILYICIYIYGQVLTSVINQHFGLQPYLATMFTWQNCYCLRLKVVVPASNRRHEPWVLYTQRSQYQTRRIQKLAA